MKEPILFSGELKSTEDMCTFYSVNLQHSCIEFEIRVGGEFSETMSPSPKDNLELSIIWSAAFAAGFMEIVFAY
jgi:hypothetical protein